MHPIRLFRPSREFVLVRLELVLELPHTIGVFIEEDLATKTASAQFFFPLPLFPSPVLFFPFHKAQLIQNKREQTHRPVPLPKPLKPQVGTLKLLRRQLLLVHLGDHVPAFLMLLVEQQDSAGGLRVEGRGHVQDSVGEDLLDAGVGYG